MEDLDNSQWMVVCQETCTTYGEPPCYLPDCFQKLVQVDQATEDIPLDEDLPTTEIQTQDF